MGAGVLCEVVQGGPGDIQVHSVKQTTASCSLPKTWSDHRPGKSEYDPTDSINWSPQTHSNQTSLSLTNLEVMSTGRYRCEVSTEAPMFSTESGYGDLLVIVLPDLPPEIIGKNSSQFAALAPGDKIEVNCTSRESKPAADLNWFINGKKVRMVMRT